MKQGRRTRAMKGGQIKGDKVTKLKKCERESERETETETETKRQTD